MVDSQDRPPTGPLSCQLNPNPSTVDHSIIQTLSSFCSPSKLPRQLRSIHRSFPSAFPLSVLFAFCLSSPSLPLFSFFLCIIHFLLCSTCHCCLSSLLSQCFFSFPFFFLFYFCLLPAVSFSLLLLLSIPHSPSAVIRELKAVSTTTFDGFTDWSGSWLRKPSPVSFICFSAPSSPSRHLSSSFH